MRTVLKRERKTGDGVWREGTDIYFRCVLSVLVAVAFLSACVIVPTSEHGLRAGRGTIAETDIGELEVGKTTREQVLLRFGEPLKHFRDGTVFIYPWSVKHGYMAVISYVGAGAGPLVRTYQVTLEFDEQGLLTRHERQKYGFFYEGGPGAKGERFSADDLKIPDGKTGILVYRSSSLVAINSFVPIRLDDEHLVDLQYGGFAIAVTDPGDHTVGYPSKAVWDWEWKTLNLVTKPDERVFIKVKIGFKFGWMDVSKVELEIVPEGRALDAIKNMRRSPIVRSSYLFTD